MADDVTIKIGAKDNASPTLDKVQKKADKLDGEKVELTLDAKVGRALDALDKVADQTKRTQTAADALGKALGPELADRMDVSKAVRDFQRMGFTLEEIVTKADVLGGKLREIDDANLGGKLAGGASRAKDDIDSVGKSADSSKNALANMIGNSAQDLGQLGGVAGTAGVALGQFAEFAADAKFEGEGFASIASNFAAVVGPVAALSIGVGLLTHAWENYQKAQAEAKAATADASKALEEQLGLTDKMKDLDLGKATTAAEAFNRSLIADEGDRQKTVRGLGVLGKASDDLGQTMINLERDSRGTLTALAEAGGIPKEYAAGVAKAVDTSENFGQIQGKLIDQFGTIKGMDIAKVYDAQLRALEDLNDQQQKVDTTTAAQQTLNYAKGLDAATAALERQAEAAARAKNPNADAVDILNEFIPLQKQQADNADAAVEATKRFAKSQDDLNRSIEDGTKAMEDQIQSWTDRVSAAQNWADLGQRLKKADEDVAAATQKTIDTNKDDKATKEDKAKALDDEIDKVISAGKIQAEYRHQQELTMHGVDSATQQIDEQNRSLEEQARNSTPAAKRAVYDYLIQLNLIPEEKATAILAAVDKGDIETANKLIDEASQTRTATINVDANTDEALKKIAALGAFIRDQFAGVADLPVLDAGGKAPAFGGIAGERRPEILNERYLVTRPTWVPPGTRVTSGAKTARILKVHRGKSFKMYDRGGTVPRTTVMQPTINVQAAVIGSTFDVMNAVNTAMRRAERLLPRHP